ncbi:MAG TPA: hypothetical protein VHF22_07795, partial [Planctomycetota bacterium]|nr:hypothetical protein [Planctomycetota bacterium]
MSTHFHALAIGAREALAAAVARAAAEHERAVRRRRWLPGPLFGPMVVKAFPVEGPAMLAKELGYLYRNPLDTHPPLAEVAWEYPWTSAREFMGLSLAGLANVGLARRVLGGLAERYGQVVARQDLEPVMAIGEPVDLLLAAAAQTFGLLPAALAGPGRTPRLVRARSAFLHLGWLEGYRQHQLGPLLARSAPQVCKLAARLREDDA